jgi:hypothetical protein
MTKMKKLLFLFDTDPYASVFDTVVAYDGGADRVAGYANVTPDNVGTLVDGTIFTRGGKEKQNTAIFVGGGDKGKGEARLKAVKKNSSAVPRLGDARPNGSNTTPRLGGAVAKPKLRARRRGARRHRPVGMRAAALPKEAPTSPHLALAEEREAAKAIEERFG